MLTRGLPGIQFGAVLLALVLALLGVLAGAGHAFALGAGAAGEKKCVSEERITTSSGKIKVRCVKWADVADERQTGGSGGGVVEERVCKFQGEVIDCVLSDGSEWSTSRHCYLRVVDPPPPADDERWDGHTDGVIVGCWNVTRCVVEENDALLINCPVVSYFWAERVPGAGPTPREVAQDVVASMQLRAGEIGLAPPSYTVRPGSQFIVGIPAWMWVDNPGEATTGPLTRSDSQGGVTVSATARLDRIDYSMGDGGSVTCGAGTRWTLEWGEADSPDCGYTYTRPGDYTVTARSFWTVEWSGAGESGTIPLELENSTPVRVGEIQVLVTS